MMGWRQEAGLAWSVTSVATEGPAASLATSLTENPSKDTISG